MKASVTIYTKDFCPYCTRAKALLDARSIPFYEIAGDTPENRAVMGGDTFPQVWVGDHHIGGSDDLWNADQDGSLGRLLYGNSWTPEAA